MTGQDAEAAFKKVKELVGQIYKHKILYYRGRQVLSDVEYDALEEELRTLDPGNPVLDLVGYESPDGDILHDPPMLSTAKFTINEIQKWARGNDLAWGYKVDGTSAELVYLGGNLVVCSTRGDGSAGQNITEACLNIPSIPKKVEYKGTIKARGEIYMPLSKFDPGEGYKSPRNLAAGTLNALDPLLAGERGLEFMAWQVVIPNKTISMKKQMALADKMGFKRADRGLIKVEQAKGVYEKVMTKRNLLDYEIDGIVFKINDPLKMEEYGVTPHHPKWIVAVKFPATEAASTIIDIQWRVGQTGRVVPLAVIEPVDISGATIRRVTAHNVTFVEDRKICVGDGIVISRSGDVIPKIISVRNSAGGVLNVPFYCPSCGEKLVRYQSDLKCANDECGGKMLGKIDKFVKVMDIKHLGKESIRKLWKDKWIKEPADLYLLSQQDYVRIFGVNGKKIHDEISRKKRVPCDKFLESLGIAALSRETARKIARAGIPIAGASESDLTPLEGIGDRKAREIVAGVGKSKVLPGLLRVIEVVTPEKRATASNMLAGKGIYITGKVMGYDKDSLRELVETHGGKWKGMSKSLDLLVVGESPGEEKLKKAAEYGVKMISFEKFREMIG